MSDWTCDRVEGWIDLYAAGEADGPTRAAVGRHLQACEGCAESHRQAQQLHGLLDQRFQESARLERLWSRLDAKPERARRPTRLALWRAAALAASVLLTFGLFGWLGPGEPGVPPERTARGRAESAARGPRPRTTRGDGRAQRIYGESAGRGEGDCGVFALPGRENAGRVPGRGARRGPNRLAAAPAGRGPGADRSQPRPGRIVAPL